MIGFGRQVRSAAGPQVVTRVTARRVGGLVQVAVDVGGAAAQAAQLYWVVDGQLAAVGPQTTRALALPEAALLEVYASPQAWPADAFVPRAPLAPRETLFWVEPDGGADEYVVAYATGSPAGSYTDLATLQSQGRWAMTFTTPRLVDQTWYTWRVTPYRAGTAGTPLVWSAKYVVRAPDVPDWTLGYDSGELVAT